MTYNGCYANHNRMYETYMPIADKLYNMHLETLKKEQGSK